MLEADCTVCDDDADEHTCEQAIPECVGSQPHDGETPCYVARLDPDGLTTIVKEDDMSQAGIDRGGNAEFVVIRWGGKPPAGTVLAVSCTWSTDLAADCPALAPGG